MSNFIITTDNTTDLPPEYYIQHDLHTLHVNYMINDVLYDGTSNSLDINTFYDHIRNGCMPVTQQANPEISKLFFKEFLDKGLDIIHIAFSSGLSGTYNSSYMAAEELRDSYPNQQIVIIDSLCASLGEGLLVHEALKRKNNGMSFDDLVTWLQSNKLRLVHEVMADDLFHLHRGGRVSKTSAIIGSALGIKPMIHVNNEGKLIPFSKQRGKPAALNLLVKNLIKKRDTSDDLTTVFICHSDCIDDANTLKTMILEKTDVKDVLIYYVGPTIGSHTGIGTVAVFYFAANRDV